MNFIYSFFRTKIKLFFGKGVRKSYSQFGEDAIAQSLLRSKTNGFYVDVGAFDPVLYSNTYAFYKKGWRGIVIDPNKDLKALYALLRPRDIFIWGGIGEKEETKEYYRFNDASYNTFSPDEIEQYLKKNKDLQEISHSPVSIKPLSQILKEQGVSDIDFLNIDVQGMDLQVLHSLDWNLKPKVIAIEDESFDSSRPTDSPTFNFLVAKGYSLIGLSGLTLIWKLKPNEAVVG